MRKAAKLNIVALISKCRVVGAEKSIAFLVEAIK
jgi:hypothetical protein